MRSLGFALMIVGVAWAIFCIPLYRARINATTSKTLEILTGKESVSREDVYAAMRYQSAQLKNISWWFIGPTLMTFCGGLLRTGTRARLQNEHGNSPHSMERL